VIKIQGMKFSISFDCKCHETFFMDSATSSVIVPWSYHITEIP
jgi:hypothetical protein